MSGSSIPKHFQGRTHTRKYRRVQALEEETTAAAAAAETEKRRKYTALLAATLGQTGLPRWRNKINACLYDYIQTGGIESVLTRTVERFLLLERLSFLKIALRNANMTSGCEVIIPLVLSFMKKE